MVTSTPSTISCAAWGFAPDSDGCTNREADSSLTSATEDQAPSSTPAHGFRQSEASAKQSRFTGVHWHEASSSWGFRLQVSDGVSLAQSGFRDEQECTRVRDEIVRQSAPHLKLNFQEASSKDKVSTRPASGIQVVPSAKALACSSIPVPGPNQPKQTQQMVLRSSGRAPVRKKWNSAMGKWDEASATSKEDASSRRQKKEMGLNARKKSSQYRGVCWDKHRAKWRTSICTKCTYHYLGYFDDEREAALAYDVEARKLGRKTNFPEASVTSTETTSSRPSQKIEVDPNTRTKSSQYWGVHQHKKTAKLGTTPDVSIKNTTQHLGCFDDELEVALAYDDEARKLGREVNFPEASNATPVSSSSLADQGRASSSVPVAGNDWDSATGTWDEASAAFDGTGDGGGGEEAPVISKKQRAEERIFAFCLALQGDGTTASPIASCSKCKKGKGVCLHLGDSGWD